MRTEEAIRALTKIFQVVGYAAGDQDAILGAACEQVLELLQPDVCLFVVADEAGGARIAAAGSREAPGFASDMLGAQVSYCRVIDEGIACWSEADGSVCAFQADVLRSMASHMCVPIMSRERTSGVLCVAHDSPHIFSDEEKDVYLAVAGAIAASIENAALYARVEEHASSLEEQVRKRTEELTVLYDKAQALIPSADFGKTVQTVLAQMAGATNSASGIIVDGAAEPPRLSEPHGQMRIDPFRPSRAMLGAMLGACWTEPMQLFPSYEGQPEWAQAFRNALGDMLLGVPLADAGDSPSLVILGRPRDCGPYSDQEIRIARALARQAAMAIEVSRGYEHDNRIAHAFQQSLLPSPTYSRGRIHVACKYQPALSEADVGGDIYDVWPIGDRVALLVADLSGKGIKAAVNAAMLKFSVRSFSELRGGPAEVVTLANQALQGWLGEGSAFATLFYAEIDPETGDMSYANAGHEPPALVDLVTKSTTALEVTGPLAGMFQPVQYGERRARILANHVLVVYTDGISEAERGSHVLDQSDIGEVILGAGSIIPSELSSRVFEYAVSRANGALHDDAAVVVVVSGVSVSPSPPDGGRGQG